MCKMFLFHYTGTPTLCAGVQKEEEGLCRCIQSHEGECRERHEGAAVPG